MTRRALALAAGLLTAFGACAGGNPSVAVPDGYRMGEYLAPVPARVPGAVTVGTDRARALFSSGEALFVDVLPAPVKPPDFPEGRLWLPKPRRNIPGSLWLPGVGLGRLGPDLEAYFDSALAKAIGPDRERALVVYCRADCWMSWNAAKRLAELGYRRVYWYPEGTDGWSGAGLALQAAQPWQGEPTP